MVAFLPSLFTFQLKDHILEDRAGDPGGQLKEVSKYWSVIKINGRVGDMLLKGHKISVTLEE
jgi:hypothetical protein